MMTLGEAIAHAECVANGCEGECADDHRQLAEWLKELRKRQLVDGALQDERNLFVERLGDYGVALGDARAENAKLRELVRDMWANGMCECDECGAFAEGQYHCVECEYHYLDRMHELGIEAE